jgi:hypothetical protein
VCAASPPSRRNALGHYQVARRRKRDPPDFLTDAPGLDASLGQDQGGACLGRLDGVIAGGRVRRRPSGIPECRRLEPGLISV